MHIADADARITHYRADFFERLESVGYGDFCDENPKKCMNLLIQHLSPAALNREMRKRISYDEGLEKKLKNFISFLSRKAINYQVYGAEAKDPPKKT